MSLGFVKYVSETYIRNENQLLCGWTIKRKSRAIPEGRDDGDRPLPVDT